MINRERLYWGVVDDVNTAQRQHIYRFVYGLDDIDVDLRALGQDMYFYITDQFGIPFDNWERAA